MVAAYQAVAPTSSLPSPAAEPAPLGRLISHLDEEEAMETVSFEGLSRIGQINIPVHDLETAIEFYRTSLAVCRRAT